MIHLLNTLHEEVQHMGCDEESIPGLSDEERLELTKAVYAMGEDLEEWDGKGSNEFSTSTLCDLALTWLGVPYRYGKAK